MHMYEHRLRLETHLHIALWRPSRLDQSSGNPLESASARKSFGRAAQTEPLKNRLCTKSANKSAIGQKIRPLKGQ